MKTIIENNPEETGNTAEELTMDKLNEVTGAGDPFADTPRNPEQPIDDDLRKDG
ncbi:MAG: hypothetical protein IKE57_02545 [Oscillospiraceae bacterium]|nr:hypothetical protein [Oscillospiraceae bacterium]